MNVFEWIQHRFLFVIDKHPSKYKIIEILQLFQINVYIKIRTLNTDRLYKISEGKKKSELHKKVAENNKLFKKKYRRRFLFYFSYRNQPHKT